MPFSKYIFNCEGFFTNATGKKTLTTSAQPLQVQVIQDMSNIFLLAGKQPEHSEGTWVGTY